MCVLVVEIGWESDCMSVVVEQFCCEWECMCVVVVQIGWNGTVCV